MELQVTRAIRLNFLTQYEVNTSTLMENDVGIRYISCCWEVRLGYIYRNRGPGQKTENSVYVRFSLRSGAEPSKGGWEGFRPAEEAFSGDR